jgi:hypothetical protein
MASAVPGRCGALGAACTSQHLAEQAAQGPWRFRGGNRPYSPPSAVIVRHSRSGGNCGPLCVTATVWGDRNGDGKIDRSEPGRHGGTTVELLAGAGKELARTTTAADGTYTFPGVSLWLLSTFPGVRDGGSGCAPLTLINQLASWSGCDSS